MKNIVLPDAKERKLTFYLAMEEYVAGAFEEDCVFVWRVAPTVIIGRNQDMEAEVNMDYCRSHGVRVVRRKRLCRQRQHNDFICFVQRRCIGCI